MPAHGAPPSSGPGLAFPDGIPLDLASRLLPRTTLARLGLLAHIHLHAAAERRTQIRESLANLSSLARISTHYHRASSPGGSTLPALTGLLAFRRDLSLCVAGDELVDNNGAEPARSALTGPSSLVGLARAQGFRVEVYGWYNPYCDLLAGSLDTCRSVSMYNTASRSRTTARSGTR